MTRIEVTIESGARRGHTQCFEQLRVVIGRRGDCDLRLAEEDDKASGRHAEIVDSAKGLVLRDLKATNGTFVNGMRITSDFPLKSGDVIQFGKDGPLARVGWAVDDALSTQAVDLASVAMETHGKTTIFKAMVVESLHSNRRTKRAMVAVVAALVAVVVVVTIVLYRQGTATDAAKASADAALQGQGAAQRIATANERAIFMLIAKTEATLEGYCTAFAISADGVLATNAHCVRALESYRDKGASTIARMNRHPDQTYAVADWKVHPGYAGDPRSPDVALVRLELHGDRLPAVAALADAAAIRALVAGQHVYTMGFPGQVMNEREPAADLRATEISRLTDFKNAPGNADTAQMVWHAALTSKGTSGSPLFDEAGRVVAVNNGGLSAKTVTVTDPKTGALRTELTYEATGLNFGVRADLLAALYAR